MGTPASETTRHGPGGYRTGLGATIMMEVGTIFKVNKFIVWHLKKDYKFCSWVEIRFYKVIIIFVYVLKTY